MRKILLISAAMLLSICMYADDITHHWPEVKFTIVNQDGTPTDGVTYHIPGWDAWHRFPKGNSLYVYSHLRVQKYEKTGVDATTGKDVFKARLVTRYIVSPDNRLTVPTLNQTASEAPIWVKFEGHEEIGVKNIRGLQYKDVFGTDNGPDGTNYKVDIIDEDLDSKIIVTGTLAIPAQMTHAASGEIYNIDEIGDYALRQYARTTANRKYNYIQASKLIIPKEITKVGRGAFFNNCHTKEIEFEEGSSIEEIPEFNFQDNTLLEKITFPASVKKLWGTVLGGCPALTRIEFKGVTPPATPTFTWNSVARKVFESTTTAGATVPANCVMSVPLVSGASYAANDLFRTFKLASPIAFPDSKIATCCSSLPFTVSDGMEAFYVQQAGIHPNYVSPTAIDEDEILPDRVGFILIGTTGTEEIFYPITNEDTEIFEPSGNWLVGAIEDTPVTMISGYSYFVLNTSGEFIPVTQNGTLPANKAYLMVGSDWVTPLNSLAVTLPEETGIVSHEVQKVQDNVYYTLQGTQVSQPQKGLVIKNGKKYIVK